jgi:hypothetical protein
MINAALVVEAIRTAQGWRNKPPPANRNAGAGKPQPR